uniref:Uncharacterized protein n=1 Tax=viral metagenome TaxID=1070528 RepID=A0A6C0BMJ2_9ZZZZ
MWTLFVCVHWFCEGELIFFFIMYINIDMEHLPLPVEIIDHIQEFAQPLDGYLYEHGSMSSIQAGVYLNWLLRILADYSPLSPNQLFEFVLVLLQWQEALVRQHADILTCNIYGVFLLVVLHGHYPFRTRLQRNGVGYTVGIFGLPPFQIHHVYDLHLVNQLVFETWTMRRFHRILTPRLRSCINRDDFMYLLRIIHRHYWYQDLHYLMVMFALYLSSKYHIRLDILNLFYPYRSYVQRQRTYYPLVLCKGIRRPTAERLQCRYIHELWKLKDKPKPPRIPWTLWNKINAFIS